MGGGGSSNSYSPMQFLIFFASLLLLLPSLLCLSNATTFPTLIHSNTREALGIGIGIGIGGGSPPPSEFEPNCPPPAPPTPCPPPPNPPPPPPPPPTPPPPSPPPPSPPPPPPPPPPRRRPPPPPPPPPPSPPPPRPKPKPKLRFVNELQRRAYYVIQRFKKTITCDPNRVTRSWSGAKVCKYKGFFCETPPNRKKMPTIASVDFNTFGICAPTVKKFVDQLPDLALFHANSNNFSETIPFLAKLQFFYELDVSNNKLTGLFPMNVLPSVNLSFLDLRFNKFSGPLPPAVFDLKLIQVLFLNNNNFYQRLPDALGHTTAAYLTFANNRFTGPIPRSIGRTRNTLIEVLFLNNQLSGCLPYEVGLLKKATVFDAGTNYITGPIPLSFGCLKKVEQLNLAQNLLYGEVPDVLCRLADVGHLANLSLSSNYFTWVGTSCWQLIKRGILDVRKNCIRGLPEQRSPAECAQFLKQPKYCPYLPHIPCRIPRKDGGAVQSAAAMLPGVEVPAVGGGRDKAKASRYSTYSALHNGRRP